MIKKAVQIHDLHCFFIMVEGFSAYGGNIIIFEFVEKSFY